MKLKISVRLLALALAMLLTSCKPKISGQIVPELANPGDNFRVVDGQIYDRDHSEQWNSPLELAGLHPHQNENFRLLTYFAKVETVEPDNIQCEVYEQAHWPPVANGEVESENSVQEIVIYHYPNAESLVSGQFLDQCNCMRVANYISGGVSLKAFDCGTKSTERVPEIKGAIVKAGGVQIFLVEAKEVEDFLQKRKDDSEEQTAKIDNDIVKLKSELNVRRSEFEEATNSLNESFTNDSSYVALLNESETNLSTVETLAKAVKYLRANYGDPPEMFAFHYPQEQRTAWVAIKQDIQRMRFIQQRESQIATEEESLPERVQSKREGEIREARSALNQVSEKLDKENNIFDSLSTPNFYFKDFSPAEMPVTQTDELGYFTIRNPAKGAKLFAKLEPANGGTNSEFFWLLDLPHNGETLILSETNLFALREKM